MIKTSFPPFSAKISVLELSQTIFNLSMTASSIKLISSNTKISPFFIASTNGPSLHSNND